MQWRYIESNWHIFSPIIQQRWEEFSNQQLQEVAGSRKSFSKLIEDVYAINHLQAEYQVTVWQDSVINIDGHFYISDPLAS